MSLGLWRRTGTSLSWVGGVLILAGALGNYADRVMRGYVVDFIYLRHWPVFNVADVCVTLGAAMVAWNALMRSRDTPAVRQKNKYLATVKMIG